MEAWDRGLGWWFFGLYLGCGEVREEACKGVRSGVIAWGFVMLIWGSEGVSIDDGIDGFLGIYSGAGKR